MPFFIAAAFIAHLHEGGDNANLVEVSTPLLILLGTNESVRIDRFDILSRCRRSFFKSFSSTIVDIRLLAEALEVG